MSANFSFQYLTTSAIVSSALLILRSVNSYCKLNISVIRILSDMQPFLFRSVLFPSISSKIFPILSNFSATFLQAVPFSMVVGLRLPAIQTKQLLVNKNKAYNNKKKNNNSNISQQTKQISN